MPDLIIFLLYTVTIFLFGKYIGFKRGSKNEMGKWIKVLTLVATDYDDTVQRSSGRTTIHLNFSDFEVTSWQIGAYCFKSSPSGITGDD